MCFQDVAFLPSLKTVVEVSLGTTTCLKTVVGVSKGMLPVEYYRSTKPLFCVNRI